MEKRRKLELIEKLNEILEGEITQWEEGTNLIVDDDRLKIWKRNVNVIGQPLEGTEVCFRIQALIKDISPYVAFMGHMDPEFRKSWDTKMSDVQIIEQLADHDIVKYYIVKGSFFLIQDRDVVVR